MTANDLTARYNYDTFVPENFGPWMRFHESPPVGQKVNDFPLWQLDGSLSSLQEQWSQYDLLVVEFGSFT